MTAALTIVVAFIGVRYTDVRSADIARSIRAFKIRILRGSKMFKWLSCKHSYQFYNTRIGYDCMVYGYYNFEFVCPKCKKEISVSQREIDDLWAKLKSDYNKNIVLGGKEIKSSELTIPHYRDCDHGYCSPVTTLLLRMYLIKGIDLTQISKKQRKCSYAEGAEINAGT